MEEKEMYKDTDQSVAGKEKEEFWFSSLAADDSHVYDTEKAFGTFHSRTRWKRSVRFHAPTVWYHVAAVAFILIASALSYWQGEARLRNRFADIVMEAPLGSKSKLVLPDGSLVWLNAGSKIVYSQGFGVSDRHLELSGEAYFEVSKNEKLPFDVHTKELDVTVLGTKFNFRNYDEDEEVVVNLLEGRVRVDNNDVRNIETRYLSPLEKVVLNKLTGEMKISKAKVANANAWMNDRLFFDEISLADISKELERSYDVKISIRGEHLEDLRFYGIFNKREQTIQEVLDIITDTGKLRYKEEVDSIILFNDK